VGGGGLVGVGVCVSVGLGVEVGSTGAPVGVGVNIGGSGVSVGVGVSVWAGVSDSTAGAVAVGGGWVGVTSAVTVGVTVDVARNVDIAHRSPPHPRSKRSKAPSAPSTQPRTGMRLSQVGATGAAPGITFVGWRVVVVSRSETGPLLASAAAISEALWKRWSGWGSIALRMACSARVEMRGFSALGAFNADGSTMRCVAVGGA
jgi:hypothetical protein